MLLIGDAALETLRRDAEARYPLESCGVLVGRAGGDPRRVDRAVPCDNASAGDARRRYALDPRELWRVLREAEARGEEVVGFYHSHPDHPALPSATDLDEAHWPGFAYVITAVERGRAAATRAFVLEGEGAARCFRPEELAPP